jgi:hypothetical protein
MADCQYGKGECSVCFRVATRVTTHPEHNERGLELS